MVDVNNRISFLSKVFDDVKISRDNKEISVRCTQKGCGKPGKSKLCIRMDNEVFHCWVCDYKGRGIAKLVYSVSKQKGKEYTEKFGGIKARSPDAEEQIEEIKLPEDWKILMNSLKDPNARAIYRYAKKRGFTDGLLWRYRCGYSYDKKWSRRLLMPSFDCDGNLNYLTGRAIDSENWLRYVNESLPKQKIIFNEIDLDFTKPMVLVEGPLDLIKCPQNSTCLLGSSLNENSILFYRITKNRTPIILLLDDDAKSKAMKIAKLLSAYSIDVRLNFPKNGDIGDCTRTEVEQLVRDSVSYTYGSLISTKIQELKR